MIEHPEKISNYRNGNCDVVIYRDGSKSRSWEGIAQPHRPESVDLKITDWCDIGCPHCHESSTVRGDHASLSAVQKILDSLEPGTEVAIGGGDPLSYPDLDAILRHCWHRKLIANITVNQKTLFKAGMVGYLNSLMENWWIHGLGVSFNTSACDKHGGALNISLGFGLENLDRVVLHMIAGIHDPFDALHQHKVLVLGYKDYGRGSSIKQKMPDQVEQSIARWRYFLMAAIQSIGLIAFDTLAVEQLRLRDRLPVDIFNRCFMGEDGQFSLYIDAVKEEYAKSSVGERYELDCSVTDAFHNLRSL